MAFRGLVCPYRAFVGLEGFILLFIVRAVLAKIPLLDRNAKREEFHLDIIHPLR